MFYSALSLLEQSSVPLNGTWQLAALGLQQAADAIQSINPMGAELLRTGSANAEMAERISRHYGRQAWAVAVAETTGKRVPLIDDAVTGLTTPFGQVTHFVREDGKPNPGSPVLIVAPMSGHHSTLLRGTVEGVATAHDPYITDWNDARNISLIHGKFDVDDYTRHVINAIRGITEKTGRRIHVLAVCQPGPAALVATTLMEMANDPASPLSFTAINSPMDARESPTAVNHLAQALGMPGFMQKVEWVPLPYTGVMRPVYPSYQQIEAFWAMNPDRHIKAHLELHEAVRKNDKPTAERIRKFYDEFLAGADMPAEFYLQTMSRVFLEYDLPRGQWKYREGTNKIPVDTSVIRRAGILTVECHRDDVCGIGQTDATHKMTPNALLHRSWAIKDGGHYAGFSGTQWRTVVRPTFTAFTRECEQAARLAA
jgi:poly(3-hydroxybutyrate) depolymerase